MGQTARNQTPRAHFDVALKVLLTVADVLCLRLIFAFVVFDARIAAPTLIFIRLQYKIL